MPLAPSIVPAQHRGRFDPQYADFCWGLLRSCGGGLCISNLCCGSILCAPLHIQVVFWEHLRSATAIWNRRQIQKKDEAEQRAAMEVKSKAQAMATALATIGKFVIRKKVCEAHDEGCRLVHMSTPLAGHAAGTRCSGRPVLALQRVAPVGCTVRSRW